MIRGFTKLEIKDGETVISQGEAGDHFYIVINGNYQASLSQLDNKVVAKYGVDSASGLPRCSGGVTSAARAETEVMRKVSPTAHAAKRP